MQRRQVGMEKSYSGQSSYRFVEGLMRSEDGMLRIVSPFLDVHYARFLVGIAARKRIRVITTGKGAGGKEAVAMLSRGFRRGTFAKVFIYFAALAVVLSYIGMWVAALGVGLLAAVVLAMIYKRFKKGAGNIEVRVSGGPFVHEKIYIGSDTAITGSANLTYSGMHRNIEHIEITHDPERIAELGRHFNGLWNEAR